MSKATDTIFKEALELPFAERVLLVDQLAENIANDVPHHILKSQIDEARRRLNEIRSGKVVPIPGDVALKAVRDQFGR